MNILDGKKCARHYRDELSEIVKKIVATAGAPPRLSAFLVGDDQASAMYVRMKEKACTETGIATRTHRLAAGAAETALVDLIEEENADPQTSGILVQLPLPRNFNEKKVLARIRREKDADCFLPENIGRMLIGGYDPVLPCTPFGVMKLLKFNGIELAGREVCIIGRSNIVGKPLAVLMLAENATVTICHSKTRDLPAVARRADVLVAAIGRAGMIDASFVKPGAVVVDVGINRTERDGRAVTCGDCDFESVSKVAGWITPVPGGVGPMTIAMVLYNTVKNYIAMKGLDIRMPAL